MKFEYQMTKKDEQTFLFEKHKKTNRIYLIIFTIIYFILMFSFTIDNFFVSITIYIIFFLILYGLLLLTNWIFTKLLLKIKEKDSYLTYTFIVNDKGITQKSHGTKIEILWKDVKKIVLGRNYSIIYPKKNNIAFLFRREAIEESYPALLLFLKTIKTTKNKWNKESV